ncbi:MAG: PEP-CTERM sorting domain-containing protein [Roseateles depolymerans]|uniref:PEP-CTERM sorting domain-containing protein n=1 Tax=Roseateles depolymerans TaxID=76731 RepID=A0A2W5FRK1_9BURK|nr:MAG: PEP-CTERM sorting domain-containing protein [Roseateles depolymerans]
MASSKVRLISALLGLSALAAPAFADPTVSVSSVSPVTLGSGVDVQLLVSGVSDLFAYQLAFNFDPTVLQVGSVTEGAFLGTGGETTWFGGATDNATGSVSFIINSLNGAVPGVNGSGVLATIHFDTVGAGTSSISFSETTLLDSTITAIATQSVAGSVTVSAVPEPSSYLLMALGAAGLAVWRRRQFGA